MLDIAVPFFCKFLMCLLHTWANKYWFWFHDSDLLQCLLSFTCQSYQIDMAYEKKKNATYFHWKTQQCQCGIKRCYFDFGEWPWDKWLPRQNIPMTSGFFGHQPGNFGHCCPAGRRLALRETALLCEPFNVTSNLFVLHHLRHKDNHWEMLTSLFSVG